LRKREIEDMKILLNQIKNTKMQMEQNIEDQGAVLDKIERNVDEVVYEKSEVLIKENKELEKNSDNLKKKICILISVVSVVVIIGLLGGIIAIVASK